MCLSLCLWCLVKQTITFFFRFFFLRAECVARSLNSTRHDEKVDVIVLVSAAFFFVIDTVFSDLSLPTFFDRTQNKMGKTKGKKFRLCDLRSPQKLNSKETQIQRAFVMPNYDESKKVRHQERKKKKNARGHRNSKRYTNERKALTISSPFCALRRPSKTVRRETVIKWYKIPIV